MGLLDNPAPYGGRAPSVLDYLDRYSAENAAWKESFAPKYRDYVPQLPAIQEQAAQAPTVINQVAEQTQPVLYGDNGYEGSPNAQEFDPAYSDPFIPEYGLLGLTALGFATGMPLGTAGRGYNQYAANELGNRMGYDYNPGTMNMLGDMLSGGLLGRNPRDFSMMAFAPESFNRGVNPRALEEYAAYEAQQAAAQQAQAQAAAQAAAQRQAGFAHMGDGGQGQSGDPGRGLDGGGQVGPGAGGRMGGGFL